MEKCRVAIIGGGAAGLFLCNALANNGVLLIEKGERLGRKLSATGNGQGNLTNLQVREAEYFSVAGDEEARAHTAISAFDDVAMRRFFSSLGVLCAADERGRVYPCGRQASALTDALRFSVEQRGIDVRLGSEVVALKKEKNGFVLTVRTKEDEGKLLAERVVLCAGGKAAKNFGTDGKAYALAEGLGHTVSPLYPSLVQLKTDVEHTKTLKGIRINDGGIRVRTPKREFTVTGDIIFTEYGVSGDATFRLSAFIADEIQGGRCALNIDFLPERTEEEIYRLLQEKREKFSSLPAGELLFGVVNNQVGRAIMRRAQNDLAVAARLVKTFPLSVKGSLGFDYAQVTKGGIPLREVTENLESKLVEGLYFAGEILDVDGQCGGYNLQWAFSSACVVAKAIDGGQV